MSKLIEEIRMAQEEAIDAVQSPINVGGFSARSLPEAFWRLGIRSPGDLDGFEGSDAILDELIPRLDDIHYSLLDSLRNIDIPASWFVEWSLRWEPEVVLTVRPVGGARL